MPDIPIPADSDLSDAEAEELMLLCGHAPGPEPLSPAAQAVLDAVVPYPIHKQAIAAALRAAADQVIPEEPLYGGDQRWMYERDARQSCRKRLLAIADELEGQGDD